MNVRVLLVSFVLLSGCASLDDFFGPRFLVLRAGDRHCSSDDAVVCAALFELGRPLNEGPLHLAVCAARDSQIGAGLPLPRASGC